MSLNRQTVLRGFPRCQLTDMFQQEAAGSGRESASAAADIMSGRRYRLVTSGELVEETVPDSTSRISVPYNWQLQEYQPSTVINVKKVEDQSSPASCTNSTSVRISSHQQHDGDIHPRSNTISHHQIPHPVQFAGQLQHTATYPSAVGRQTERVQHRMQIPSLSKQMMNSGAIPVPSNRESVPVLQKFNEELQQQMLWKTGNSLSSVQEYTDYLKQSPIKPVPVKAQPSLQRFHPLMSSGSSRVPSSTVVPSTVQTASNQSTFPMYQSPSGKRTQNSSNVGSVAQCRGLPQLNVHSAQSPVSSNSDARNRYLSVGVSQSAQFSSPGPLSPGKESLHSPARYSSGISQPAQFSSPGPSSVGRRLSSPGKESLHSPARYSSGLASDAQHVPVPGCPTGHGSPVQQYSPQKHGIRSPVNYGSPIRSSLPSQSPQTRMLSHGVPSVNLGSPSHIASKQQSGIRSPSMSFSPPRSQVGYGAVRHAVHSPSMSVSAVQVNQQIPSAALLSQQCHSAISPATLSDPDRSTSRLSPGVGSEVGFAATCSVPRSATGLRHYRMMEPTMSLLPPLPKPQKGFRGGYLSRNQSKQSVLPPARAPRDTCKNLSRCFSQQPSNVKAVDTLRQLPKEKVKERKTVNKAPSAALGSVISPSKFFVQGSSMDFDSYIGKLVAVPQKQTAVKSECSTSPLAMEVAEQRPAQVCDGVKNKRKLQRTESETEEVETGPKMANRYVDNFQQSYLVQGLLDIGESDSAENKWSAAPVPERQLKVP